MEALFGGSFNPVHIGHLIIARDVLESFSFEKILFVPARIQPLKGKLQLPDSLRVKLLKLATDSVPYFDVWDIEIRKGGVSYTVETLRTYKKLKNCQPVFIMGSDSFKTFLKWKEPEEILRLAKIIVVKRPNIDVDVDSILEGFKLKPKVVFTSLKKKNSIAEGDIFICDGRLLDISSTEIRERLKEGRDIRFFLPEVCVDEL